MRGADDRLTLGERIAFYRARRGLTQAQLAQLAGRSADWLSKIERGERQLRNIDTLAALAGALRVSLGDLLGQPVLLEDEPGIPDVPAVRDALMAPARLSRVLYAQPGAAAPVEAEPAVRLVEFAWADYQRGRLGQVVVSLASLIRRAQQLEDTADSLAGRRHWAISSRTHHLAATTLAKLGEADLSWIAAERAVAAADRSDDVLVIASAARAATHALLAAGRLDDAVELGETAATWLAERTRAGSPAALSLIGMLHLRTAVAAARSQDRATAHELLDRAEHAATRLGHDANHWQTAFGPTNVALHRISAALDLGDVAWAAEHGPDVDAGGLPVERQVTHLVDTALALAHLARDTDAVGLLLTAERQSPALVRHSSTVRETVKAMYRRAPVTGGARSSDLLALAQRCRAVR